mgnify:CR=1 FL=1
MFRAIMQTDIQFIIKKCLKNRLNWNLKDISFFAHNIQGCFLKYRMVVII